MSVVFATAAPSPTDAFPVIVSGASGSVAPSSGDVTAASSAVPPGRVAAPPATASKSAAAASTAAPQKALVMSPPAPLSPCLSRTTHPTGPPEQNQWAVRPIGLYQYLL